jgi:hypothetical protein
MKHFLIKYQFKSGSRDEWHRQIEAFIAALESDPELKGRIGYRCMKERDSDAYFHIASPVDDAAVKTLQSREFFTRYTAATKLAAGGDVQVVPLEIIAQTSG